MAHGRSLTLREVGGVKEALDVDPTMFVNEDGTKREEPKKLNRRERRARTSVIKKFIRKAKKNERLKSKQRRAGTEE